MARGEGITGQSETKREILGAAGLRFVLDGFRGATVDAISLAAGVTKRTFYYHFRSKDDLIAAYLGGCGQALVEEFASWLPDHGGTLETVVRRPFERLAEIGSEPRWRGHGIARAAFDLAGMPGHPARAALLSLATARLELLSDALHRAGAPAPRIMARDMLVLFDGASLQMAIFHDPDRALQAAEAASSFLLQGAGWLPCAA